jgi:hypothetical protein
MIKDIIVEEVKDVTVAVGRTKNVLDQYEYKVFLINNNELDIENTLVSSKGYGVKDGVEQTTSILRHYLDTIGAQSAVLIEPIDPAVFHLNNEYWVSYYIGTKIFDKRFVFVPDSIRDENFSFIEAIEMEGVLHS